MVNKEELVRLVEGIGHEGRDIFGGVIWEYIKEAIDAYNGEPITPQKTAELMLKVMTPVGWIEEERPKNEYGDSIYRPRPVTDFELHQLETRLSPLPIAYKR